MPTEQSQQDAVDNAALERLIRENTALTKEMYLVLTGDAYGREGLVKTVAKHSRALTWGTGFVAAIYLGWEAFKWFHPSHGT